MSSARTWYSLPFLRSVTKLLFAIINIIQPKGMNLKKSRKEAIKLSFMYKLEGVDRKEEKKKAVCYGIISVNTKSISTFFIVILSFILYKDKMIKWVHIILYDHFLLSLLIYFYFFSLCNIFFSYFFYIFYLYVFTDFYLFMFFCWFDMYLATCCLTVMHTSKKNQNNQYWHQLEISKKI